MVSAAPCARGNPGVRTVLVRRAAAASAAPVMRPSTKPRLTQPRQRPRTSARAGIRTASVRPPPTTQANLPLRVAAQGAGVEAAVVTRLHQAYLVGQDHGLYPVS